jgi:hypothetical protein
MLPLFLLPVDPSFARRIFGIRFMGALSREAP